MKIAHRTKFSRAIPSANGIMWQTLVTNVDMRRSWEKLGVSKVCFQWLAVDGYSFVPNPWLPLYSKQIDMLDVIKQPWGREVIVGLPGYFNETTARASLDELTDLGKKFGTLGWTGNIGGFYFPVEIDPTWTAGPAAMAPFWSRLPRPLYVTAYYGAGVQPLDPNGISARDAALWLYEMLPKDVNLMFQDGIGAFGTALDVVQERIGALHDVFHDRLHIIGEAFTYNEDYQGEPGTYYRALTDAEYRKLAAFHSRWQRRGRLWMFDGPNYLSSRLIQRLGRGDIVNAPAGLSALRSPSGTIKIMWESASPAATAVLRYRIRIYDTSGNKVLRTIVTTGAQTHVFYTAEMGTKDFGFPPEFLVYDVQEVGVEDASDPSAVYVATVPIGDFARVRVGLAGTSYVGTWFSDYSDIIAPGITAKPGTPKGIAAYKLRQELAARTGYDIEEVEVVDLSYGGSYLSKTACYDVQGWSATNYWWDDQSNSPGPNLLAVQSRLAAEPALTHVVWAGGNDNLAIQTYPGNTDAYLGAIGSSFGGVLAALTGDGAVPVWVMPNLRSYFGAPAIEGTGNAPMRNKQLEIIAALPYARVGSFGVGAGAHTGYWEEPGPSYVHQLPAYCHATAVEFAQAIAEGLDRIGQPPVWVRMGVVTVDVHWTTMPGDIYATWTPAASSSGLFRARCIHLGNQSVLFESIQAGNRLDFTEAQQVAAYGFTAGGATFNVAEYDQATGLIGPETSYTEYYPG